MFRNDPLESLKVSSTFDSIPFVRDYLQKEIEGQLRTLLMDEVPAIIHRLSLRLWVPEQQARQDEELSTDAHNLVMEDKVVDPLACPPADPSDLSGHILDGSQITSLSLDSNSERQSLFSQKNLLRLGALAETHKTLSLSTPNIRDAVFRAWAGPTERGEFGSNPPVTPLRPYLSRGSSAIGSTSTTYVFSDPSGAGNHPMRPTLSGSGPSATGLSLGTTRYGKSHGGRKRKRRIVNLRKRAVGAGNDMESVSGEGSTISGTTSSAPSELVAAGRPTVDRDGELLTPPRTPEKPNPKFDNGDSETRIRNPAHGNILPGDASEVTPKPLTRRPSHEGSPSNPHLDVSERPRHESAEGLRQNQFLQEKSPSASAPTGSNAVPDTPRRHPSPQLRYPEEATAGSPEHAWVMRIVGEIARRVHDEKAADSEFWERTERHETPPPAYGS